jgi:propane monooxygenase reductase component
VPDLVLRVSSVRRATPGSRIVRVALDGAPFDYAPGQLASLGPPGVADRIPYSLASAPEDTAREGYLEFLIKVDAGGRWGAHFQPLRRGAPLAVRGPSGSFVFPASPRESRFLFIAGGTGIAPLRSMIRHAVLSRIDGRVRLLYSARTPRDFAYLPELRGMERQGEMDLALSATREVPPRWRGERGRIAPAQIERLLDDPVTLCFVCGPAAMVAEVPPMLQALGVDRSRIRLEDW